MQKFEHLILLMKTPFLQYWKYNTVSKGSYTWGAAWYWFSCSYMFLTLFTINYHSQDQLVYFFFYYSVMCKTLCFESITFSWNPMKTPFPFYGIEVRPDIVSAVHLCFWLYLQLFIYNYLLFKRSTKQSSISSSTIL